VLDLKANQQPLAAMNKPRKASNVPRKATNVQLLFNIKISLSHRNEMVDKFIILATGYHG
jgi:hypothetical protein